MLGSRLLCSRVLADATDHGVLSDHAPLPELIEDINRVDCIDHREQLRPVLREVRERGAADVVEPSRHCRNHPHVDRMFPVCARRVRVIDVNHPGDGSDRWIGAEVPIPPGVQVVQRFSVTESLNALGNHHVALVHSGADSAPRTEHQNIIGAKRTHGCPDRLRHAFTAIVVAGKQGSWAASLASSVAGKWGRVSLVSRWFCDACELVMQGWRWGSIRGLRFVAMVV